MISSTHYKNAVTLGPSWMEGDQPMTPQYFEWALRGDHETSTMDDPHGWAWIGFRCAYDQPPAS